MWFGAPLRTTSDAIDDDGQQIGVLVVCREDGVLDGEDGAVSMAM